MAVERLGSAVPDVPAEQVVNSSGGRGWAGLEAAEILHPDDDFVTPAVAHHVLVLNLGRPMEATERQSGRAGQLGAAGLMILPAGRQRDWHLEPVGQVRHLHLYLAPELVRGVAAEAELDPDRVELFETYGARDAQLEQVAQAALAEVRAEQPAGRLYAGALGTLLAVRLLRRYSSFRSAPLRGPRGLPAPVLQRALDFIETHLAEDLTLAELARAADYSSYHFAHLFKAATGSAPHQYVVRRRVERARLLLTTTELPLARIAEQVGFANSSHLARHFQRLLGIKPADCR
jgi:AraC family transcriptional regulator